MKTIFLIGFMGCGKSTIGKKLSKEMNKTFVDTDDYIENKYKEKIANIFQKSGEETFRTYEKITLNEVSSFDIVATGGGIVENKENIQAMKTNGVIVYLNTPFEQIKTRLANDKNRPLWDMNQQEKMKSLYNRRSSMYENAADIILHTGDRSIEEVIAEMKKIKLNV